jgi:bifunctional DNA-binding transcriptional regulator/antitoxin component of YhaV-PrlF toxin-antitoxin module
LHCFLVLHSTITDKYQTTLPVEVRQALKLLPRQRVSYELRPDGSVILRPVPALEALFGSLKSADAGLDVSSEKNVARQSMASEAAAEGLE